MISWGAETSAAAPPTGPEAGDLRPRYAEELALRHFTSDPEQLAVVTKLEDLPRCLREAASGSALRRCLAALTGCHLEPVRGRYLWGSVGLVKTWLMDL